jgi:hypothetical protein
MPYAAIVVRRLHLLCSRNGPDHLNCYPLESTTLATAGYDEHRCALQLDFRDGARYQYSAVPPHLFHDLLAAPSKGSFFNRHIRGRFHHVKLAVEN